MTAPEASVTEPRISPEFVFCASARPDTQIKTTKTRTAFIMECLRPKHGYLSRLLPALYAKPAADPVPHLITRGILIDNRLSDFQREPYFYPMTTVKNKKYRAFTVSNRLSIDIYR